MIFEILVIPSHLIKSRQIKQNIGLWKGNEKRNNNFFFLNVWMNIHSLVVFSTSAWFYENRFSFDFSFSFDVCFWYRIKSYRHARSTIYKTNTMYIGYPNKFDVPYVWKLLEWVIFHAWVLRRVKFFDGWEVFQWHFTLIDLLKQKCSPPCPALYVCFIFYIFFLV